MASRKGGEPVHLPGDQEPGADGFLYAAVLEGGGDKGEGPGHPLEAGSSQDDPVAEGVAGHFQPGSAPAGQALRNSRASAAVFFLAVANAPECAISQSWWRLQTGLRRLGLSGFRWETAEKARMGAFLAAYVIGA